MKEALSWFYDFTRGERLGLVFLITVITFFILIRSTLPIHESNSYQNEFNKLDGLLADRIDLHRSQEKNRSETSSYYKNKNASKYKSSKSSSSTPPYKSSKPNKKHQRDNKELNNSSIPILSNFDPNTTDSTGLSKLGLSTFATKNILKWRKKGGAFKKANDLKKIYGISEAQFKQINPYIKIAQPKSKYNKPTKTINPHPTTHQKTNENKVAQEYIKTNVVTKKNTENKTFYKDDYATLQLNLNTISAIPLQELRGIGEVLSTRIIKFRDKLGGFHSVSQLKEVYGITDSLVTAISKHLYLKENIDRININDITEPELKKHPYINWKKAKLICRYRDHHGPYENINSLFKIGVFDSLFIKKIEPYLAFE